MSGAIEIRAPGMAVLKRELGAEALIIGKKPREGSNAIALPNARELADEHLIVSLVRDRFLVALAPGARIEPSLKGHAFKQAEVAFGDEVVLGSIMLRFAGKEQRNAPSPVIVIAGAIALGLVIWTMVGDGRSANLGASLPAAPPLFEGDPSCPYVGPQALGRGAELEQAAMAHGERYVFEPHDGVEAASEYRQAGACYNAGGDPASAARARDAGQRWQSQLEARYQGHQLRLRLALDRGRKDSALREVRSLLSLLQGRSGAYVSWLAMAERNLQGV